MIAAISFFLLVLFGLIGLRSAAKYADKQDEIYRKESDGRGGC